MPDLQHLQCLTHNLSESHMTDQQPHLTQGFCIQSEGGLRQDDLKAAARLCTADAFW